LADAPFTHFLEVDRRLCTVAFTVCAGVRASAPETVMRLPDLTLVGAVIESAVLWQRELVAFVFGAVMPANAMTATATASTPMVPMVSVFLMLLLRRTADHAAVVGPRARRRMPPLLRRVWSSQQFSGRKQSERCVRVALV
jgi:hypothetical protein